MTYNRAIAVIEYAADIRGWSLARIIIRCRERQYARTRFAIMRALKLIGLPCTRIARELGLADHTSVLHGLKEAERLRLEDIGFRRFSDKLDTYALSLVREAA